MSSSPSDSQTNGMICDDVRTIRELLLDDDRRSSSFGKLHSLFPGAIWSTAAAVHIFESFDSVTIGPDPLMLELFVTELTLASGDTVQLITIDATRPSSDFLPGTPTSRYHRIEVTRPDEDTLLVAISLYRSQEPPRLVQLHFLA